MTLSADIARCLSDNCPKQTNCARTQPAPKGRSRRQVYAAFSPDPDGYCGDYIPTGESRAVAPTNP
jgi:hypothetical protein